ncbi:hypothetical protein [Ferruginibacter albus]|uniref:hypothetical protein n=1 Tax=Ferruginibacter albus TaxID=2875540 RepID=UPI001CC6D30B|nr:hypothetical protein [Ferruginibacter albus]UAY51048.1 hypothetical protein K9M53_10650 [Ferruginibacter albus]
MITNLNNVHFTQAEKDEINQHWTAIRQLIETKKKNLTPEERKKYGSVAEQNKLVVMKVLEYNKNQPHLNCPEVDYVETIADWDDRTFVAGLISGMAEASLIFDNIRITHDYDAYNAARTDYNYVKYRMEAGDAGAGWETKYNDLLPFFKTNNNGGDSDTPDAPANNS